uniref:RING-type E3 ubiquitin transferase n=1 Tax=Chromera velia CCMP2878 TaxID=1169474 RepID=A0A0G4GG65_9ALVE|eukprot:Cvel_21763.t1-p1 / transcript=Cvel_21763.t1 / gene=Cvel_21763 / organism=Chromera_velia_CCMP2878 / gene_product=E3 ubiquitin-protein ligase RNF181, putative / transcript_product=E3 ubiquitin-protein ligase RNF181, putative / location=Cvel_scaffold2069:21132-22496(+) / protein_length=455 / sequence_SO=supercontig / SO=protein_coding / is_pseudo=false
MTEGAKTILEESSADFDAYMFDEHLKPFFESPNGMLQQLEIGGEFMAQGSRFKLVSCFPSKGVVRSNTRIHCVPESANRRPLARVHILPVKDPASGNGSSSSSSASAQADPDSEATFSGTLRPWLQNHMGKHFERGDTFTIPDCTSGTGSFCVVAVDPPEGGLVSTQTAIHCEGPPVRVLSEARFRVVAETIPPRIQHSVGSLSQSSATQLANQYLRPHFMGRPLLISSDDTVIVVGVHFKVASMSPPAQPLQGGTPALVNVRGLSNSPTRGSFPATEVVCDTLTATQAFEGQMPPLLMGPIIGGEGGDDNARHIASWLRQRLLTLSDSLEEGDPRRPQLARLIEDLSGGGGFDVREMLRRLSFQGASDLEIARNTMTWKYKKPGAEEGGEEIDEDDERHSCRICLVTFEEDEDIRCLPCLHRFHSQCIMSWLKQSKACPICKNEITRHMADDDD